MMNKEKYLNKIKKLLNLAKGSSNSNESAIAMRQAQKLIREHNISVSDIDFMEIVEASSKGAPSNAAVIPKYMAYLAELVNRVFGVKCFHSFSPRSARRIVTFYGPNERPQVAAYAFDVLSRQIVKARREFISTLHKNTKPANKTAKADRYCQAWVEGAYHAITDFVMTEAEETLVTAYKQKQLDLKQGAARDARDCRGANTAAYQGYIDGKNAKLNQAVSGATVERIGG